MEAESKIGRQLTTSCLHNNQELRKSCYPDIRIFTCHKTQNNKCVKTYITELKLHEMECLDLIGTCLSVSIVYTDVRRFDSENLPNIMNRHASTDKHTYLHFVLFLY